MDHSTKSDDSRLSPEERHDATRKDKDQRARAIQLIVSVTLQDHSFDVSKFRPTQAENFNIQQSKQMI